VIQSDSELAIHVLIVITSRQTNLTQDRIAAADGRFNSIRQVAPMCTHIWCRSATLLRVETHFRAIFRHRIVYGNSALG